MPFYTIISLVIAVSGATYAAMHAFREHHRDLVNNARAKAAKDHRELSDLLRGKSIPDEATEANTKVSQHIGYWDLVFIVPLYLFLGVAFLVGIHACLHGWLTEAGNAAAPNCDIVYRVILTVLIVIDLACVIIGCVSSKKIRTYQAELAKILKDATTAKIRDRLVSAGSLKTEPDSPTTSA